MTGTSATQGMAGEDTPVARRGLASRVPIWVWVSVIIGVVLVGVLLITTLLAAGSVGDRAGSGAGHGSRANTEMNGGSCGDHSSPSPGSSGAGHGSGAVHGSTGGTGQR